MYNYVQMIGGRIFDVATEPTVIRTLAIPILLIAAVIVLLTVTLILIKRARAKNIRAEKNPEDRGSCGEIE